MYSSSGARNDDEIAGKEQGFACTCLTRKGSRRPEAIHRDGPNIIGHQIARRPASESQNNKRGKCPMDSPLIGGKEPRLRSRTKQGCIIRIKQTK